MNEVGLRSCRFLWYVVAKKKSTILKSLFNLLFRHIFGFSISIKGGSPQIGFDNLGVIFWVLENRHTQRRFMCTPLLAGSNYCLWKTKMREFLKSLDERVWWSVANKWEAIDMNLGQLIPKTVLY